MTTDESAPSPVDGASVVSGHSRGRRPLWQESLVLLALELVTSLLWALTARAAWWLLGVLGLR